MDRSRRVRRRRLWGLAERQKHPLEGAAPPTARVGIIVGDGAPARHPAGATGRARVSLLMDLRGVRVLDSGQGLVQGLAMALVMVVVALVEVVMEVAAVPGGTKAAQAVATKTSTAEHEYGLTSWV